MNKTSDIKKYRREYYLANKDKFRDYSRSYYERNKDWLNKIPKPYNKEHNDRMKDRSRFGGNRLATIKRDGGCCFMCSRKDKLVVHHIDGNGRRSKIQNNNINNLVTMCIGCHFTLHRMIKRSQNAD